MATPAPRPRLFVAVVPPQEVLAELDRATAALEALPGTDRLRRTEAAGRHFTLAFLGPCDPGRLDGLTARLARAAHRTAPFPLALRGAGHFGDRVLWARPEGGLTALGRLADRVRAAASRAGLPPDAEHAFRPHLTLARVRPGQRVRLAPYTEALAGLAAGPWRVTEVRLIRSVPPPGGVPGARPRHETVGRWPLGG
ncbi:RNA 2',3'-cyclic phosphodiesterase [Streptomyces diastaticus]|uniref:RNA 2',3'-cyclic phosphodiesterase n=2 Tax=Streptomyces TaxID=1883 RepID=A0A380MPI9_STRGR|nr:MULTISPECIES: RNA 2',3'-cyclic phosphodiesterase [Streptomyces]WSU36348.1 RNA 2',3'-cyclic phosphodiesterase [Streptomyces gougerotii]PJM82030.1 RNA 2',3'-cyclic phosphodiesterase [Streptomyces sp. TSRI0384-2]RPK89259.1 2',5' RNA ligase family [Streptomyces sp. ADI98-12]SUO93631.1 2, 5 RNA ligase [Streptomyces griseus]GFH69752.1 RNA 2',3'-cyclic phosphodiesterase [Streptomyces diastaticus subsp. diastaticus]